MSQPQNAHLDEVDLARMALGEDPSVPGAAGHLGRCGRCRELLGEFRALDAQLTRVKALPDPPSWFRTRALAAIRMRRQRGPQWLGFMSCLHDSILAPARSAVRGPASSGRQLLLEAPGVELAIRLLAPGPGAPGRVTGQVTLAGGGAAAARSAPVKVEISDLKGGYARTEPDRFGLFSVAGDFRAPLIVTIHSEGRTHEAFVPEATS